MKDMVAEHRSAAFVVLGLVLYLVVAAPAHAYMGGPIRAHIAGLEPEEQRVYYYLTSHDESGAGPEVWFFGLEYNNPGQPRRARSLEGSYRDAWREELGISDAWRSLSSELKPLYPLQRFRLAIGLRADSAGRDSLWMSPRYDGHLVLEGEGVGQAIDLTMFCHPMIRVRGPYGIPGRPEAIAVVSYKGLAYGCEEVEEPILLVPTIDVDRRIPTMYGEARPATWKERSFGRFGRQFVAHFGELGPSDNAEGWYFVSSYVMADPPQVWLVNLEDHSSKQSVRYRASDADSSEDGWDAWKNVRALGGRQTEIHCTEDFDLNLHLVADSVGVDSTWGVPHYKGQLLVETPDGVGAVNLEMFCNTLVQIRGVYRLPERSELVVFVSYTASASGCEEWDVPIVIYSR
jgi:hypothetical protein